MYVYNVYKYFKWLFFITYTKEVILSLSEICIVAVFSITVHSPLIFVNHHLIPRLAIKGRCRWLGKKSFLLPLYSHYYALCRYLYADLRRHAVNQSGLLWRDWEITSRPINWTILSKKGEPFFFCFVFLFRPRAQRSVYFSCLVLLHFYSFLWQVSHLHRCSTWYRWCPLHVLPLLYLCPDRKMSCSDHPALQTPHCGVDELYYYISCAQKGASKKQSNPFLWDMSRDVIILFIFDLHHLHFVLFLQKVFISIKGIYYQAEVMGQLITWLVPYQFAHDVSK